MSRNRFAIYIVKRLCVMIVMLAMVSLFIFLVLRTLGVDPVVVLGGDKGVDSTARAELEKSFGLNKPLLVQYGGWVAGVFTGNLGIDYVNRQNVAALIAPRIPITIGLVSISMIFAWFVGIPLGILSAVKRNTAADTAVSVISLVFASTPSFIAAILIVMICARFFPSYSFIGSYGNAAEYFSRIVLPAAALSFVPMALIQRVTRSSMIEQMKQGYILTARAKGLGTLAIVLKHGFRNAVLPMLTVATMMVGTAVAGAVLVETVFSLPGIGSLLIGAVKEYNYPVTQSLMMLLLFIFLFISFVLDVLYVLIDPRVSLK